MPSTIASIVMGGGGEDAAERPSVASLSGPLLLPPPPVRWLFPLISSIINLARRKNHRIAWQVRSVRNQGIHNPAIFVYRDRPGGGYVHKRQLKSQDDVTAGGCVVGKGRNSEPWKLEPPSRKDVRSQGVTPTTSCPSSFVSRFLILHDDGTPSQCGWMMRDIHNTKKQTNFLCRCLKETGINHAPANTFTSLHLNFLLFQHSKNEQNDVPRCILRSHPLRRLGPDGTLRQH